MPSKIRTTIVSIITLIVFVFSAVFTVPVLADGETPPPVEGTEPAPPVEEEPSLAEVPEGTQVVVLNEQGESVPLATQEAAEIIAGADPIWCPSGVAVPKPGMNGCTTPGPLNVNYDPTSLTSLLAYLAANQPAKDGTIWIEGDFDSGTEDPGQNYVLDGDNAGTFNIMGDYRLTIKGGWDGCTPTCVGTTDPNNPSEFNGRLQIFNWNNDVTLSDLYFISTSGSDPFSIYTTKNITLTRVTSQGNFSGGGYLDNSAGTGKITINSSMFLNNAGFSGLRVFSTNLITLNNVTATGNTGYGVFVNGTLGTADIMINGGQFSYNQGLAGLSVQGNGMITLNNVTASGNSGASTSNGVQLDNTGSPGAKGITLSGVNIFNDNKNHGLSISTAGAITANDVTADNNGISGAYGYGVVLNNTYASGPKPITFTGTNIFTDNRDGGLYINTFGAVKLNSVHANSNNGMGVYIYNAGASTAQAVTLSGTSTFKYNNGGGLLIDTKGLITLNNVTANANTNGDGVSLNNNYALFSSGVNITGTNTFNDNASDGLRVMTRGAISAMNLNASGNGDSVAEYGVYLDNLNGAAKSVTLNGVNTFNNNYFGGLYVTTKGAITANSLNASGNTNGFGVNLENSTAATAQAVKLTGTNVFSDNYSYGLYVSSLGAISVNSFTANSNGTPSSTVYGVYLYNNTAGQGVTLSGVNTASNNYLSGLYVTSQGTITVNSLRADENGLLANGSGASITNTGGIGSVIFTGTSSFNDNQGAGLEINSAGTVTLSNISASNSVDSVGVFVQNTNSGASAPKNVMLSGVNVFSNNDNDGLSISTYGVVTLNSVSAIGNGTGVGNGNGVSVTNPFDATLARDVILTGTNVFSDNGSNGLAVSTLGSIKLNNVTANNNDSAGVNLNNLIASPTVGNITLTGVNTFNDNDGNGLYIITYGIVTASNLNATGNGGQGASIDNSGSSNKTVTLSGVNKFNDNQSSGLTIVSQGTITASSLSASGNLSEYGVQLSNNFVGSTGSVTLTGASIFNNNYYSGLDISSRGAITLNTTSIQANGNGTGLVSNDGYGVYLNNASAAAPKAVVIKGNNTLLSNYSSGLRVVSKGAITANNLISNGSINGAGADLDNDGSGAVGAVTITGTNTFNNNYNDGLYIVSLGAITTNNITANQNGLTTSRSGASLASSGAGQAIKMTGSNTFNGNQFSGLSIDSLGAVSINNLTANDTNAGGGASIYNNGGGTGNVTLTGLNTFNNNSGDGLQIGSNGNVSLTKIYADGNTGDGLYTNPDGTVTLTCGNFTNNGNRGWYLLSLEGITITGVVSAGNGAADVWFGSAPVVTRNCPLP